MNSHMLEQNSVDSSSDMDNVAEMPEACPRCAKPLIDPSGLGWCAGCGYCKSLANDPTERLLAEQTAKSPLVGVVATGGAIVGLPMWFWACFPFLAVGIVFSIYNGNRLPAGENLPRALWATLQIVAGLSLMIGAQICALIMIAPEVITLTFKDAIVPFKLWGLVAKRLPQCKECVWIAVLGFSLIVGSAVFIGGFGHWFTYLPKSVAEQLKEKANQKLPGDILVVPVD